MNDDIWKFQDLWGEASEVCSSSGIVHLMIIFIDYNEVFGSEISTTLM